MRKRAWFVAACLASCCYPTTATGLTDVIVNGGFESPAASGFATFIAPGSFLGWTVASGGVDIVASNFYAPASGVQSLDLNSVTSGSVFQNITTTVGQPYLLSFSLAANPLPDNPAFASPAIKQVDVLWNGAVLGTFTPDATGRTATNVGWQQHAFAVIGVGRNRVTFTSLTGGSAGPAIDNVSLTAVPEPSSVSLAWLALASGRAACRVFRRSR
jgi:choice-of-anchor C domain-containing protein